ncbi:MAG: hypothetical protein NTV94_13515 [Planctomycetota bacterium]|nr:hypothetical protein [Planctomycetota bacterium]
MILGTTTERSLFLEIAVIAASTLVGWGLFRLGRSALESFVLDLAESALSPRTECFACGYPIADIGVDEHGFSRCSECGLLVRPNPDDQGTELSGNHDNLKKHGRN